MCLLLLASCAAEEGGPSDASPAPAASSPASPPRALPSELSLSEDSFDGQWPLTLDQVTLHCEVSGAYKLLTFDADDGTTYALNGSARQYAETEGWTDYQEVWQEDSYGGNVNASDLISEGIETLCP